MKNINSAAEIKLAIQEKQFELDIQGQLIKEQFNAIYESLKPASIINNTLKDIATSPFLLNNIIGSGMGLLTGFLSKKIAVGSSENPFRIFLGTILQFGVTNLVAQNPDAIRSLFKYLLNSIFHISEAKDETIDK
jgi:hypothetical protein